MYQNDYKTACKKLVKQKIMQDPQLLQEFINSTRSIETVKIKINAAMIEDCIKNAMPLSNMENWVKIIAEYQYIDFKRSSFDWTLLPSEENLWKEIDDQKNSIIEMIWLMAKKQIEKEIPKISKEKTDL